MKKTLFIIISILVLICTLQFIAYDKLKSNYSISKANEKSLLSKYQSSQNSIIGYQTTISSLQSINDSVTTQLLETKKKLHIKDKEVNSMISASSEFRTHDTIILSDTIPILKNIIIDTSIINEWYNIDLKVDYPSIYLSTLTKSSKDIIMTTSKETIDPPKKLFICRLFQRKHKIARIYIDEKNPYISSENNVYIKIID